jgi:hypothetical protein
VRPSHRFERHVGAANRSLRTVRQRLARVLGFSLIEVDMAQVLTPVSLFSIEFSMRGNKVIHASDALEDPDKFKTRSNPTLDIFKEVFAKIIVAAEAGKNTVDLMIADGRFIVRDTSFPLPSFSSLADAAAHLGAARDAANAMHAALNGIEATVSPKRRKRKPKRR